MLAIVLSCLIVLGGEDSDSIRIAYHKITDEATLDKFIEMGESSEDSLTIPYLASAYMQKAEYVFSPFSKLKYFNQGKKMLETFIEQHPSCIDARYVRFLVQTNVPGFLGYSDDIIKDKDFVQKNIGKALIGDEIKSIILNNLNTQIKNN